MWIAECGMRPAFAWASAGEIADFGPPSRGLRRVKLRNPRGRIHIEEPGILTFRCPGVCADKSSGERLDNCADNSSGEVNVAEATVSTLEQRKQRWRGDGEPETWPAQYPPDARVVMFAGADSREKAIELLEKLGAVCGQGGS